MSLFFFFFTFFVWVAREIKVKPVLYLFAATTLNLIACCYLYLGSTAFSKTPCDFFLLSKVGEDRLVNAQNDIYR